MITYAWHPKDWMSGRVHVKANQEKSWNFYAVWATA
jgi:hypothetical protein